MATLLRQTIVLSRLHVSNSCSSNSCFRIQFCKQCAAQQTHVYNNNKLFFKWKVENSMKITNLYTSVACNRTTECADWGPSGLIAYGACNAVAVLNPRVRLQ